MKRLTEKLRGGMDLNAGDISLAVAALFSDATNDLVKADFLTALHRKGETVEEILGFVQQLIDRAIDPLIDPKNLSGPMIDVCGTGGDGYDLFNVSTTDHVRARSRRRGRGQAWQSQGDLVLRQRRCAGGIGGSFRFAAGPFARVRRTPRTLFHFRTAISSRVSGHRRDARAPGPQEYPDYFQSSRPAAQSRASGASAHRRVFSPPHEHFRRSPSPSWAGEGLGGARPDRYGKRHGRYLDERSNDPGRTATGQGDLRRDRFALA